MFKKINNIILGIALLGMFVGLYVFFFLIPKVHSIADISFMNSVESKKVFNNIYLHSTSGSSYTLTDGDGNGLIYGNITHLDYDNQNDGILIVVYNSFDSRMELG